MSEYLRVLVVHRQITVANEIKRQFDGAGWLVHMAQSGLDGLLTARKECFSLILSAVDLPVITGIEMVRGIRNFSFNVNTPVIFIGQLPDGNYEPILEKLKAKMLTGDLENLSELINNQGSIRSTHEFMKVDR